MKRISGRRALDIAASIEQGIHSGTLKAGELLPTVRALAASLHVSPVTVSAAYRQLHARGLVRAEGRRGTRVRPLSETSPVSSVHIKEGSLIRGANSHPELVDLASGNPDPRLLPALAPALRSAPVSRYAPEAVLHSLATFAAAEFAADGIHGNALTVTSGALDAIQRLLSEHLRPGDRVAVEDPCLPALLDLLAGSGLTASPLPIDPEGPHPEGVKQALGQGVRALILTTRAQNPTGGALSSSRAADLVSLTRGRDLLVIENDAAGPIAGAPAVTLSSALERWAVVRSVSKYLGPDLRLAVVTGDDLSIARLARRYAIGPRWVSYILQHAAVTLWSDPAIGRHLARVAGIYAQRRTATIDALARYGINVTARSGFNIWIPVREETAAVQALAARGWAVAAGERFRIRSAPGIRVTTSGFDVAAAPRFAADCAAALRESGMDLA